MALGGSHPTGAGSRLPILPAVSHTLLLHDLALLGFAVAHGTDGDVQRSELASLWAHLETWAPGENPALIEHALREAALTYSNGLSVERLDEVVERLRDVLGEEERARVVAGLQEIAEADDAVHPAEEALVARVVAAFS